MAATSESRRLRSPHRPRRRWWHWPARVAALAAAALVLLYATVPWWAPKRWLADVMARKLSRQLQLPVSVGRLELSWADGVTISDLRIANPEAFGGGELAVVGRLRCELAPLKMLGAGWLSDGRLDWAELTQVGLHAAINEAGQANLAPLKQINLGPPPQRLVVRDAAVTIQLPRQERQLRLDVSDLQYRAGRLKTLGRLSMSAPVTLAASTSRQDPVASGSFRFARVDISQLGLPQLLGLPLKRLNGIGSGGLQCRVSSDGTVEGFLFSIRVKDLDAQPKAGPTIPVIQEAEVSVSARYDWYTRHVEMDEFRLRLPGLDLGGRGRIHAAVLSGGWEGVHSLDVAGAVNPARLAALLSGKPSPLPGGLTVDGDVQLRLSLRGSETQLSSSILLDATAARLEAGNRTAKPAGRRLAAELQGSVERRTWRFTVDQTELRVGDNRFLGAGAMQNIRRAAAKWLQADQSVTLAMVLDDLAALDWHGSWEVSDLKSLGELTGWGPLSQAHLTGRLEGEWSVKHTGMVLLAGNLRAAADSELSLGEWFVKPTGKPLVLEASGDVAAGAPRLSRFRLWAGVGESGLRIDEGQLTFSAGAGPGDGGMNVQAEGQFGVQDAAGMLACFPAAKTWAGRLAGGAGGHFHLMLAPTFRRIHVQANAARLEAAVGELFAKAAGQPADLTLDFRYDEALPLEKRNRLELRLGLGAVNVEGGASFAPAAAGRPPVRCSGRLSVTDAAWLLQRSPALGRALAEYGVRGAMEAVVECQLADGLARGDIQCDASDLEFTLPGSGGRKPRGSALRLRLIGQTGGGSAVVEALGLDLGRSSLNLAGTIRTAKAGKPLPRGVCWPPPGVAGVDLTLRGRLALDSAAKALLPGLAERLRRFAADGGLRLEMRIRDGAGGIDLAGQFDASELALAVEKRFQKPAGAAAKGRFELSLPPDFDHLQLRDLFVQAGSVQLRVGAQLPLLGEGEVTAQAALNAPDLKAACAHLPELARAEPTGGLFAEVAYRRRAGRHVIEQATVAARDVRAAVRGQPVRLDGTVKLTGALLGGRQPSVAKVATDSLEWAVGDSHGFLVADLTDPLRRPAGRVVALCTNLDAPQLQQWAMPHAGIFTSEKLTDPDRKALAARADELLARLEALLGEADLEVRLEAGQLRYFDPAVRAFYQVCGLAMDLGVKGGVVKAGFACGLNGGEVDQRYELTLKQPRAQVSTQSRLEELLARENIILQLGREFPGNMVFGTLSRKLEGSFWLRDAIMSALDGRHRLIVSGTAQTVAVDGLIRGRAAPKFVTRIFPGLNLATYRYRRMTGFADYLPDGSAENDMIFEGPLYDIYIQGTTDRSAVGRYEIGVLLLASPQSPAVLHSLRQGRIPILKFKARIEGGQFWDEQVTYARPDEAAYKIFLENNIFYRLWREATKGRRGAPSVIQPTEPASGAETKE